MFQSVLICSLLVVLGFSSNQYAENVAFNLNATLGPQLFLIQANLKNMSLLSVVSTADLMFCFVEQYSLFGNFNNTPVFNKNHKYWSHSCKLLQKTSGTMSVEIPLSMVPYAVGIFVQNATKTNFTHVNFTIGSNNDRCAPNQVSTQAGVCEDVTEITNFVKVDVPAEKLSAFHFRLPEHMNLTKSFSVLCADNTTELMYWVRRDGTPAEGGMMGKCPGEPTVFMVPRNGLYGYYLLVENKLNKTQDFSVDIVGCPEHTGGASCANKIMNATTQPQLVMHLTDIYYFKINATVKSGVWISVRRINGTQMNVVNPLIFASLNQLPQPNDADIGGCNQFYCDLVNVIHFNVTENQTWYVGIQNSEVAFNGSKAGIWFNSICAPDCQDHGTCADNGPQIGFCDCIDGFIGVDCQLPNGFGPQFIVLIIIAVLVALTAVIGFGAWAYMRRKRGQYDIVS